jgi:two-component system NtrC family response regulator
MLSAKTSVRVETRDRPSLLIVAGDDYLRDQYCNALQHAYSANCTAGREAIRQFTRARSPLVYLDLGPAPTVNEYLETLRQILDIDPTAKVVVTGQADAGYAIRAMLLGATDYLPKPVDIADLCVVLKRALYRHTLEANGLPLRDAAEVSSFEGIVGGTSEMQNLFAMLAQVATADVTILLQGESGTGKELAARAIHARSPRGSKPFVAINCAAIPDTLLEAELFGSEKGAYTGAHAQRKGKLELAEGGTLFLDEIAELTPPLQAKLLRFLQERRVERLGGRQEINVDTRVIAASNRDLKTAIRAQQFREDLYYRLSVIVVTLPPLRDRGLDVLLLANLFLQQNCDTARRRLRFSPRAIDAIVAHNWPGNIRELQNAVQRAVILAKPPFLEPADLGLSSADTMPVLTLHEARRQAARAALIQALTRTQGNVSLAARQLGVSRPVIHDLLKAHQLTRRLFRSM